MQSILIVVVTQSDKTFYGETLRVFYAIFCKQGLTIDFIGLYWFTG